MCKSIEQLPLHASAAMRSKVNVRAKGMVHRLDGCYVRQDNSVGSGERQSDI